MNKVTRISLIIISSFLLVFFCYKLYLNITLIELAGPYDFEKAIIQEKTVGDQKIITEKVLGLTMKIPSDWEYEKYDDGLVFRDPKINVKSLLAEHENWTQGCAFAFNIDQRGLSSQRSWYDEELQRLLLSKENGLSCDYGHYCELVNYNGLEGIKDIYKLKPKFDGELDSVFIKLVDTKNRRVYQVETYFTTQVPECEGQINNFLNNLEI